MLIGEFRETTMTHVYFPRCCSWSVSCLLQPIGLVKVQEEVGDKFSTFDFRARIASTLRKLSQTPTFSTACHAQEAAPKQADAAALPKVFLIGDSISLGYTPPVTKLLAGQAVVSRPATNCQHTGYGLKELEKWLGENQYDVIHFNWGIWDTHYLFNNGALVPTQTPVDDSLMRVRHTPEEYADNLRSLVKILQAHGKRLIFATTTPIAQKGTIRFDNIARYNAAAVEVMREEGVEINDLHALVLPQRAKWQGVDRVHFGPEGNERMAQQVSASILRVLQPARKE